jgi:hypothetical protein
MEGAYTEARVCRCVSVIEGAGVHEFHFTRFMTCVETP